MLAALLTDFGTDDVYVGVMRAVILSICPSARIVDLTHAIPPQDVAAGALALADASPYLPRGTVVVAVVDPGVGTDRAALGVRSHGRYFLGPDNGLLSWCLDADAEAVRLESPRYRLPAVSQTFHGRDIFAPAAAHLLLGVPLSELGPAVNEWVRLTRPRPLRRSDGALECHVIAVDRFGNLILDVEAADLPPMPAFEIAGRTIRGLVETYDAAGGQLCALVGSFGRVEIAVPGGSAAAELGVARGATTLLLPAG